MRQLEVQLIIRPPVNVLILARASSGEGRVHDREIHVWVASLDVGRLPAHDTQPVEMTTTTSLGSSIFAAARGALRSPVICSLSAVAIRARDSAPRFAQANHPLLGGWGRRAGEQLPKSRHIRTNRRFPSVFAGKTAGQCARQDSNPRPAA